MKISTGKKSRPYFLLIYGPPAVGKSTFAADAPSPVFVDIEKGTDHISTSRIDAIGSWDDIFSAIKHLKTEQHGFKTAVFDTLGAAEAMLFDKICKDEKVKTISEAFNGYGKGYEYAVTQWIELIKACNDLRDSRGMNVVVLGHTEIKTFNDPNHTLPYDRYVLRLNDKAAAKWREAVDCVLFANFEDTVFKVNKNDRKAKGTGGQIRKIYTERTAAYDAKNRLGLPPELPLSWEAFEQAAALGQPDSLENILKELKEISDKVNGEIIEKMLAAIERAQGDATQLTKILNHARTLAE